MLLPGGEVDHDRLAGALRDEVELAPSPSTVSQVGIGASFRTGLGLSFQLPVIMFVAARIRSIWQSCSSLCTFFRNSPHILHFRKNIASQSKGDSKRGLRTTDADSVGRMPPSGMPFVLFGEEEVSHNI